MAGHTGLTAPTPQSHKDKVWMEPLLSAWRVMKGLAVGSWIGPPVPPGILT